jgi:hypothetical protein
VWRAGGGREGVTDECLDEDLRNLLAREVDNADVCVHTCMVAASTAVAGCFVTSGSFERITRIFECATAPVRSEGAKT